MNAQKAFEVRHQLERWFDTQKTLIECLANGKKKIAVADVLDLVDAAKEGFMNGFDKGIREGMKNE